MLLNDIMVSPDWKQAGERAVQATGPVLILGASDTGKSTLARYILSQQIAAAGVAVLLDGDIGMATVGPPGLIGLTMVPDVDALDARPAADRTWFVGATTPEGCAMQTVLGHVKAIQVAREASLALTVNGSGFVSGAIGKELQLAIAEVIEPRLVFGLQREGELEHILTPLERRGLAVLRLRPSTRARRKPAAEKVHMRGERFASYFENAERRELQTGDLSIEGTLLGSGRPLGDAERTAVEQALDSHVIELEDAGDAAAVVLSSTPHEEGAMALALALDGRRLHVMEAAQTKGLLIGFLAPDGECLGLGLIEEWEGGGVLSISTPLAESALSGPIRIRLGSLRLARNGDELGRWSRERTLQALTDEAEVVSS